MLRSVCLSVCLSHAPSSETTHLGLWLLQNTNRKPHMEVEPTGQRDRKGTGSSRNGRAYRFVDIVAIP